MVVVVVTALVQVLVVSQVARSEMVSDARSALLYFANWHYIAASGDYFAQDTNSSPFLHFWSLAIEEQFYIVFPVLVLLAARLSKRPVRLLAVLMAAVLLVSLALQVYRARSDETYAYYATETRAYQLAAGSLLMLLVLRLPRSWTSRRSSLIGLSGLVVLGLVASGVTDWSPSHRGTVATGAAVLLLGGLWGGPDTALSKVLSRPLPRYLGQISYGVYLWHWPVLLVLDRMFDVRPSVLGILTATIAAALASLSFEVWEQPIRLGRFARRTPWRVVVAGLATSALVAAFVVAPVLRTDRQPAIAAGSGQQAVGDLAALDRRIPKGLDLAAAAEDQGPTFPTCTSTDIEACTVVDNGPDSLRVVLAGDSQAQMLGDAMIGLAREEGWTLSAAVLPGCPWQQGQVIQAYDEETQEACRQQREVFYDEILPRLQPDVVVVFGLSRAGDFWRSKVGTRGRLAGRRRPGAVPPRDHRGHGERDRRDGSQAGHRGLDVRDRDLRPVRLRPDRVPEHGGATDRLRRVPAADPAQRRQRLPVPVDGEPEHRQHRRQQDHLLGPADLLPARRRGRDLDGPRPRHGDILRAPPP